MTSRDLNKCMILGNLASDVVMGKTSTGISVANLTVATNRQWVTASGEKKQETEFSRVVTWNKLAEICEKLLKKGSKVYVEGRLATKEFQGKDELSHRVTEVIADDMILLSSRETIVAEEVKEPTEPTPEETPPVEKTDA